MPTPPQNSTPPQKPTLTQKRRIEAAEINAHEPAEIDPRKDIHGVLLSDEIIFYAENHHLIRPFDRENLKPAGYELTIGNEYFLAGSFFELDPGDDDKKTVTIPPFEVAVLKTTEILCLPRFLIARWNIRVKHAYSGLLWVGGPQVDPGYVGHLFCPIYNLSDKAVTLHTGDAIALIDFVKTTPFEPTKPKSELKRYPFPAKRLFLEEYGIDDLRSALFTRAGQKLVEFEDQIKNLESRFIVFTQLSFAIFALVIGLVALLSRTSIENVSLSTAFFGAATIAASIAAVMIALFSYVRGRVGRLVFEQYGRIMGERAKSAQRFLRRSWWIGITVCTILAFGAGLILHQLMDPTFRELRQQRLLTKSDLESINQSTSQKIDELTRQLNEIDLKVKALTR